LGRDLEGARITLNEYLDRWLETAVKPRVRAKACHDYEGMLRRYICPSQGERRLRALRPLRAEHPGLCHFAVYWSFRNKDSSPGSQGYEKSVRSRIFRATVKYSSHHAFCAVVLGGKASSSFLRFFLASS